MTDPVDRDRPPRPTWQLARPFIVVSAAGLLSLLATPIDVSAVALSGVVALFIATILVLALSLRRSERSWLDAAPAFLFFPVVALVRDIGGGAESGVAPLILLPILWLALTGTRRDMVIAAVLTAAVFVVPIILVGGSAYPTEDWRRALLWTLIAALIAPVAHDLVRQLARETGRVAAAAAEKDDIMRGARLTSIISTEVDGTIRSFSSGAGELLGYSAEELVGLASLEKFHEPTEVEEVAAELGVDPGFGVFVALAGAPSRIWTYVRADGTHRVVRLAVTEVNDSLGVATGYLAVGVDTTAAVESERRLAQAEAQWRVLMEHLPDTTVIIVDEALDVQLVAGAGAMRQGLRGTEGRPLSEVSTRPENIRLLTGLVQSAFDGIASTSELQASASGDEHQVFVTRLPRSRDGMQAMILARDVSAERERERALLRATERSERLFADAPYGVLVLGRDGVVRRANAAATRMLGREPTQLVGQHLSSIGGPVGPTLVADHLGRVVEAAGESIETSLEILDALGTPLHVVLNSRFLAHEDADDEVILVNVLDVSERRRYEERLAHLANHDTLTGLPNRRAFDAELQRHLDRCKRYGHKGALLLFDLDQFKQVNDTLGHAAGDQLLIAIASLLRHGLRSTDAVARLGGDEFAVLLPEADLAEAEGVADAIVERIRLHAATLEGVPRRVTASVGVVTFVAASEHEIDILALADMTMYDAKEAGRDQSAILEENSARPPRSGARLQWQARIEEALANDTFELHLQPIISLATNTVTAAEVLLRMSLDGQLVAPGRFLPVAERVGLMPEVDAWVLRNSIPLLARLRRFQPDLSIEVNLSGLSIGLPVIEETIRASLLLHDVEPGALILEITETAAVADVGLAREFAERMTELGCKFALDDFGAGFGSFYYLKHLLFDYVKIDGEFISHCHTSEIDRTILRSIVGIARDLGKKTIAEFVSDEGILEVVRAEGVDYAQGYLHGMPVAEELFALMLESRSAGAAP
ncbi:EAL domain-containing protein [Nocardioides sp.]|uniref:sensor domain-containing protein n=1 Tax=Nocardioides sp. TaxID=35761 RepID=UPI00286D8FE5|nr:EAL domain-containing protein [Nocardioides sp.]